MTRKLSVTEASDPADRLLQPREPGCRVPVTVAQHAVWKNTIERGGSLSDLRMCAASTRLLGPINARLLERSITAVVHRHESLRTTIIAVDGVPMQQVDPPREYGLDIVDLTSVEPVGRAAAAIRAARDFLDVPVDWAKGPLFEAKLLRLSDCEHVLLLALDHLVSDAISNRILSEEIWTLYRQGQQGLPLQLAPLPVQFADYAVWQQQTYKTWLEQHADYWRAHLSGAPGVKLPVDGDHLPTRGSAGHGMLHALIDNAISAKLRDLSQRERTPLPLVVLALYAAALSRWCNQKDFVLGCISHGRHGRPELQRMIGPLARVLILRMECGPNDTFVDLLKRTRFEFYAAHQHQGCGLVRDIVPECVTDATFNWAPARARTGREEVERADGLKMQRFPIHAAAVPSFRNNEESLMFAPLFTDSAAGIAVTIRYRSNLFARQTIERFVHDLRQVALECLDSAAAF